MSQITPRPKRNNTSEYKHYRLISSLFHLKKLAEHVIVDKVRFTIDKVISPSQFAYRPNLSTTDALLKYIEDLTEQLDDPGKIFIQSAFLNFSKAFDCLSHDLLIAKLNAYGFSLSSLKLMHSYLTDRMQRIRVNSDFSPWKTILFGVPQGSILGPLLFNIFLCDLFFIMNDIEFASYTDDNTPYVVGNDVQDVILK